MSHESRVTSHEKATIKSFTDLTSWQASHKLVLAVYELSKKFPKEEQFSLTLQIRRASVSITSNIAEGFGRSTPADRAHFYTMALGSIREVQNQLIIAKDLIYLMVSEFKKIASLAIAAQQLVAGLIRSTKAMEQVS